MIGRLCVYITIGLLLLSAGGCMVAESTYLKKVEEVDGVSKERALLQQTYTKLVEENSGLKARYSRLVEDAAALAADKKQLEGLLRAKSDILSKNVSELRQQVAELKVENSKLNDDVSELQKAKEEKGKEISGTYEQLLADMKSEIARGEVTISELKGKLTVALEASILFDSGKTEVTPEGVGILNKLVETLKSVKDKSIRIEGHTDMVQITGGLARTFPTNWELSAARAVTVTRLLQDQGVDPRCLSATAFADQKPVADNGTKEGRAKNRRIEITLVAKD